MDIYNGFYNRRSSVIFSTRIPAEKKIENLFKAARLAPSSMNQQPWRFILATKNDNEDYQKIFNSLTEKNKVWAGAAPILIVSIAELISDYNNKENAYALHDTGLATANILLQATEMGLVSHPMAGFDKEKVQNDFGIPVEFLPVAVLAVGYPGIIQEADAELQKRELKSRIRKPLDEIVYQGEFGNGLKLNG